MKELWRAQWAEDARWRMEGAFVPSFHFSLVTLARCEIQAIDQHWSLHRLALGLPGGDLDATLADQFEFVDLAADAPPDLVWPAIDPTRWREQLGTALLDALSPELESIRRRQENYLGRELQRIDE